MNVYLTANFLLRRHVTFGDVSSRWSAWSS